MSLKKLTAPEGMYLTNGHTCGKEIYLGKNDSPDNWYEITEAEAEAIMADEEITAEEALAIITGGNV